MSQIKKGAFLNYVNIFLTNIVGLVLTPFIIKKLGTGEYGLYNLIGAFVGYISVLDFGLTNAVVRFTAKYRAEGDRKGEENFLATTLIIYLFIALIISILGVIGYYNMEELFGKSLTNNEIGRAKIMYVILIFNLAISLPGGIFGAICTGYEHFVYPKSVRITRYIIRSLMVVAILMFGGKAIALVVLDTLMGISVKFATGRYVFKKLKIRIKLHKFERAQVMEIFSYSVWIFVSVLVSQLQWRAGQVVLGIVTNTTVVAIFAVGVMLGTYYGAFSTAISGVFLPRATKMSVKKASGEELTSMMIRIGRISFIVLMYVLCAFALYGRQFVSLWVGDTYHDAYAIALLIMCAYTLPLVQNFGNSILEAQNKMRFKALLYLGFAIMGTALGAFFAKYYGGVGMICGTVIGWIIVQVVMNFYYHSVIKLNVFRFLKELSHKMVICTLIVLAIGFLIKMIPGEGWLNFFIKGSLYTFIYIIIVFNFGMLKYEKNIFQKEVITVLKKFKAWRNGIS